MILVSLILVRAFGLIPLSWFGTFVVGFGMDVLYMGIKRGLQ